jgi:hypothetical protein
VAVGVERVLLIASGKGRRCSAAALSTVCAAILLLCGCGNTSAPSSDFMSDDELRAQVDSLVTRHRFGLYSGSGVSVDLEFAHERLNRQCLRSKGFTIGDPPPPTDSTSLLPEVDDLRLWLSRGEPLGLAAAVTDPERLQQLRQQIVDGKGHREEPYPAGAEEAVQGNPPVKITVPLPGGHGGSVTIPIGGCFGWATEQLYGVHAETFERTRLALPRLDDTVSEAVAEPAVTRLLGSYASCMRDRGLDVETPSDLVEVVGPPVEATLEGSAQPSAVVEAESRAVSSDADCKSRSGVGTAFARAFVAHATANLSKTEGVVVEYQKMLNHAKGVVNDLGPV